MSGLIHNMEERYVGYLQDESRMQGSAEKIAFPRDVEEIRQVLDLCRDNRMPVTLQGARTGIAGAAVPAGGLVLNLSKLNRITGVRQEGELFFLEAEPGVLLSDLKETLASGRFDTDGWTDASKEALANMQKKGSFRFAPDPTETTATVGGMFASNAKGLSGYRFGRMSDHTEQVTLMLSDKTLWRVRRGEYRADDTGCRLPDGSLLPVLCRAGRDGIQSPEREAAAFGYPLTMQPGQDLMDLLAGSEGMLGIVVSLELRLIESPAECWGILFFFADQRLAAEFAGLAGTIPGDARVTAAEFFDRASLDVAEQMKSRMTSLKAIPDIPRDRAAAVYIELEADSEEHAEGFLLELLDLFGACGGDEADTWAASGLREMEKFRLFRHAVPEGINNCVDEIRRILPGFVKMGADFGGTGMELNEQIESYSRDAKKAGVRAVIFGHALERRFHVNLLPETEEEKKKADELMEQWADAKAAEGVSLAAENGIGKVKAALVKERLSEGLMENMRAVKDHFDRDRMLNRGNMGL